MHPITEVTSSLIRHLPTGTILRLASTRKTNEMVMVLRNVQHGNSPKDIVSGDTWCPLSDVSPTQVLEIWQPAHNKGYLTNGYLNTLGCKLRYRRNIEKESKLKELQKKAQELADEIKELENI